MASVKPAMPCAPALLIGVLGGALSIICPTVRADQSVLELFLGQWNVRVRTLQPAPAEVTYVETYAWVLDRKFIRAETTQKSDGTSDVVFGTYDPKAQGYPFWVFSSTGSYSYLAPGKWDASRRILEWKNPPNWDVYYVARCRFPDRANRACTLLLKDWKGKVLLEQTIHAVRRSE
jgi:hypothetical protein